MGRPSVHGGLSRRLSLVVIVLAACWCAPPVASAAVPDGFYGIDGQSVFNAPQSTWDAQLSAMANGGLQVVRAEANWWTIEPSPPDDGWHTWDWSEYDPMVEALAEHGLRWAPVLDAAPDWADNGPNDFTPSASHAGDYAAFAAAVARRYGRGGEFWTEHNWLNPLPVTDYEIWNEENSISFWPSQADAPERYADLFAAARQSIKAVDPQARVVIGGLGLVNPPNTSDETEFLRRMLVHRPELRGEIDGVGLHPYQATVADTLRRLAGVRANIDEVLGPGVPIDITELGWTTAAIPEWQRAYDVSTLAADLPQSGCGIHRLIIYAWLTSENDPANPEDWFGIWNWDGSAKPSGQAYLNAVLAMRGISGQAPTGAAVVCGQVPPVTVQPKPRGPRLQLRLVTDKRHRRLSVFARCPSGCSLKMDLLRRRRGHSRKLTPVAHRATRFSSRRWRFKMRIPRRAGRLKLNVVASGQGGGRTTRVRWVRSPKR